MAELRILGFCDHFRPEVGGGAERVAREVYGRLARSGARVTVVTTSGSASAWAGVEPGLDVVEVPTLDLSRVIGLQRSLSIGMLRALMPIARSLRPDLLHANSLEFETSRAAAALRARGRTPLVLTAHIAGFDAMAEPWRTLGRAHDRLIGARLLRRADRLIAVSEAVGRHVRSLGAGQETLRIIPNGVDHEIFRPPVQPPFAREPRVLFVGRLVANKGADLALEAFAAVLGDGRRAHLTLVGDGPLRASLVTRARDLGIGDSVAFAGRSSEVAADLRDADVFVRPTTTEGMSLALLEAMASGVCVVASDVPGNAELIRHGVNGLLCPPRDTRALADALLLAIDDEAGRRHLSDAAFEDSQQYSWDRCAKETLDVFLDAVRHRPGRSR